MGNKKSRKEERRAQAARLLAERRARAEAEAPLSRLQLDALLDQVATALDREHPEAPFAATLEACRELGLSADEVVSWLMRGECSSDWDVAVGIDPCVLFGPSATRVRRMPLEPAELESMIGVVDLLVSESGCDHTLRHTRTWLTGRGLPAPPTEFALRALGGYCDCEVVLNVQAEFIYPRQLTPLREPARAPQRQRTKAGGVAAADYQDDFLVLPVPEKPWRQVEPRAGALIEFKLGKKSEAPRLRLVELPPGNPVPWFQLRWELVQSAYPSLPGDPPLVAQDSKIHDLEPFDHPSGHGARFVSSSLASAHPRRDVGWWTHDAFGPRVFEFESERFRDWKGQWPAVEKLLASVRSQS